MSSITKTASRIDRYRVSRQDGMLHEFVVICIDEVRSDVVLGLEVVPMQLSL